MLAVLRSQWISQETMCIYTHNYKNGSTTQNLSISLCKRFFFLKLLSLSHGETEWLSNHLGHQVEIHKDVYRQHESTVELTKISKILLAVEQGQVSRYKGKTLQEMDLDGKEIACFILDE